MSTASGLPHRGQNLPKKLLWWTELGRTDHTEPEATRHFPYMMSGWREGKRCTAIASLYTEEFYLCDNMENITQIPDTK